MEFLHIQMIQKEHIKNYLNLKKVQIFKVMNLVIYLVKMKYLSIKINILIQFMM